MFVNAVKKFRKIYATIMEACCVLMLASIILLNLFQVLSRYVLPTVNFSLAEDLTILSFCWIFGLGIFPLWSEHANLKMDIISPFVSKKVLNVLDIIIDFCGAAGGAIFIVIGIITYRINRGFRSVYLYDESFRYVPFIIFGIGFLLAAVTNLILAFSPKAENPEDDQLGGAL